MPGSRWEPEVLWVPQFTLNEAFEVVYAVLREYDCRDLVKSGLPDIQYRRQASWIAHRILDRWYISDQMVIPAVGRIFDAKATARAITRDIRRQLWQHS